MDDLKKGSGLQLIRSSRASILLRRCSCSSAARRERGTRIEPNASIPKKRGSIRRSLYWEAEAITRRIDVGYDAGIPKWGSTALDSE